MLNPMKWWLLLASLIVALLTVWLVLYAGVAPSTLLSLGAGAISLLWLVVVLTVPWNLFLAARHVLHEIQVSREAASRWPGTARTRRGASPGACSCSRSPATSSPPP